MVRLQMIGTVGVVLVKRKELKIFVNVLPELPEGTKVTVHCYNENKIVLQLRTSSCTRENIFWSFQRSLLQAHSSGYRLGPLQWSEALVYKLFATQWFC